MSDTRALPPPESPPEPEPEPAAPPPPRNLLPWLTAVGFLTNAVGTALLLNHFSIMQTAGIARAEAVQVLGVYAAIQAAVTLGTGA